MIRLRDLIHKNNHICLMGSPEDSIKDQLKNANRAKVDYSIIYGEDEARQEACAVKDMKTGEQKIVIIKEFLEFLKSLD